MLIALLVSVFLKPILPTSNKDAPILTRHLSRAMTPSAFYISMNLQIQHVSNNYTFNISVQINYMTTKFKSIFRLKYFE